MFQGSFTSNTTGNEKIIKLSLQKKLVRSNKSLWLNIDLFVKCKMAMIKISTKYLMAQNIRESGNK